MSFRLNIFLVNFSDPVTFGLQYTFADVGSFASLLDWMLLYYDTHDFATDVPHYRVDIQQGYYDKEKEVWENYDFSVNVLLKSELHQMVDQINRLSSDGVMSGRFGLQQDNYWCSRGRVRLTFEKTSTDSSYWYKDTQYKRFEHIPRFAN